MAEKNFEDNENKSHVHVRDGGTITTSEGGKYSYVGNTRDPQSRRQEHLFVWNAYKGHGGFKSGSYLYEYPREDHVEKRRAQAVYRNHVESIFDPTITPVFAKPAKREYKDDIVDALILDVDRKGTHMQKFIKSVTTDTRLLGVSFLIVDNVATIDAEASLKSVLDTRSFPYAYMRHSFQVSAATTDDITGELLEICFDECSVKIKDKTYRKNRCWNKTESYFFYFEKDGEQTKRVIIGKPHVHGLGIIPIVITYRDATDEIIPESPYFSFGRQSLGIYNKDSEGRNTERLCAFPVLALPGTKPESDVDLGADSILFMDQDARQGPQYISPPADILKVMGESADKSAESLLSQASVLGATAVNSGASAKSGDALAFEFLGQNATLDEVGRTAKGTEEAFIRVFARYLMTEIEYSVTYDSNFTPTNNEVDKKISTAERLSDRAMSAIATLKYDQEIVKQSAILFEWTDDEITVIVDSIKQEESLI